MLVIRLRHPGFHRLVGGKDIGVQVRLVGGREPGTLGHVGQDVALPVGDRVAVNDAGHVAAGATGDIDFAESLIGQYATKGELSNKQAVVVFRMLSRYKDRLAVLGVDG